MRRRFPAAMFLPSWCYTVAMKDADSAGALAKTTGAEVPWHN